MRLIFEIDDIDDLDDIDDIDFILQIYRERGSQIYNDICIYIYIHYIYIKIVWLYWATNQPMDELDFPMLGT